MITLQTVQGSKCKINNDKVYKFTKIALRSNDESLVTGLAH